MVQVFAGRSTNVASVAAAWRAGETESVYKLVLDRAAGSLQDGTSIDARHGLLQSTRSASVPMLLVTGRNGQEYGLRSAAVAMIDTILVDMIRSAHSSIAHSCAAFATQELLRVIGRFLGVRRISTLTASRRMQSEKKIQGRQSGVQRLFGQDVDTAE